MIRVQLDQDAIWGDHDATDTDQARSEQELVQQVRLSLETEWPHERIQVQTDHGYQIETSDVSEEAIADVVQAVWESWSWVLPSAEPTCGGCACFHYAIPQTLYRRGVHRAGEHGICSSVGVPRHIESNRSTRCPYWIHRH